MWTVYHLSKAFVLPIPPPTFLHVLCLVFVGQSTYSLHGTHTNISLARIVLLILSSAAVALLITDPNIDPSSMGVVLSNNISRSIAFIFKNIYMLEETMRTTLDWVSHVCQMSYQGDTTTEL